MNNGCLVPGFLGIEDLDVKVAVKAPDEDDESARQVVPRRGLDGLAGILLQAVMSEELCE